MSAAPLVEVVEHHREDRSGLYRIGGADVHLCGLIVSHDVLACGHAIVVPGGKRAARRRCNECAAAAIDARRASD